MNRREVVAALSLIGASPLAAFGQSTKVWRVGFLAVRSRSTPATPDIHYDAFVQQMREFGYVEGKNLAIEWRFADDKYERLPVLAAELAASNVDVLVTHATAALRALQRYTRTTPIVATGITDPVGGGFAASLAHPGGNITGLSNVAIDLTAKRLEFLAAVLPRLSRLAVLQDPAEATDAHYDEAIKSFAPPRGIAVTAVYARNANDIAAAFDKMSESRADALLVNNSAFFLGHVRQIAALSVKKRLPSMFPYSEIVAAGGLMSYGQNYIDVYRQAAVYVDKIIKGAKPGDLPIEQPTKVELVINRKTASAIGITVPPSVLLRADRVIE